MVIRICLTLLLVLVTFSTLAEAQQQTIVFVNVSVVPFDRERILAEQTVIIRDGRKRIAKWGADGNSIEVSEKATFDTPEGTIDVQATRKWMLSTDGKTLQIDMTVDGPNGKQVLKRTFNKK